MTPFEALILGLIQGLTEFLPISSTAHLLVIPRLLGWQDPGAAFSAVIQWGTFLACVVYFRSDILRLLRAFLAGLCNGRPFGTQEARLAWMIGVGTLPIVVCGLRFNRYVKEELRSLWVVAAAAIGLALVLVVAEWWARRQRRQQSGSAAHAVSDPGGTEIEQIGWGAALFVGLCQALALIPGASRSGVTITGALFAGFSRAAAARYSFLLSLPSVFGAGLYELYSERQQLLASQAEVGNLVLATLASAVVGYASIALLLAYLRTRTTTVFIVYRIVLGLGLMALLLGGALPPAG